jgi:hypothetical protein
METTQYTPGPWHIGVRQPSSDKFIYGPQGSEVADCDRQTNFPHENLANARLIATAPELLAALREAREWLVGTIELAQLPESSPCGQIALQCEAAIAKAEGRT